ncbi:Hypothetical predicted protein [Olea europaea subsp. europaea]|uniref:Uncharacterized protein n=1 Tax=Olea europaea subsp. europaea TaxID=158383 RepID=A0A8S0TTH4_OLEEU|nr:Hypothetical predicted protein [Olea europaea subsp. europaea]
MGLDAWYGLMDHSEKHATFQMLQTNISRPILSPFLPHPAHIRVEDFCLVSDTGGNFVSGVGLFSVCMSGSVNMDVPVQQENCETKGAASPKLLAGEGREVLHYTNLLSQNCHEVDNVQKGLSEVGIQESKQPTVEGREELHFTTVGYDLLEQKCQKVENAQKGSRGEETQVSQYNELERLEISEVLYQNSCIELYA